MLEQSSKKICPGIRKRLANFLFCLGTVIRAASDPSEDRFLLDIHEHTKKYMLGTGESDFELHTFCEKPTTSCGCWENFEGRAEKSLVESNWWEL